MPIKIKPEFLDTVIGFNNSGLPLGQRDDLEILIDIARKSNPAILNYFEEIPSLKEVEKIKVEKFNLKRQNNQEAGGKRQKS